MVPPATGVPGDGPARVVAGDWWEHFFEQDYDWLFADAITPEETERAVNDLVALVGLEPGWRVLDAPGGAGRHAVPLALLGCHVTLVDRSPTLLDRARREAAGLPRLRVVDADLRRPLDLSPGDGAHGPPFELVANLFNSLGYFATPDEDRALLDTLTGQVGDGGVLVVEVANPAVARAVPDEVTRLHDATVRARRHWDARTRQMSIHYRVEPDDGRPAHTTGTVQRLWEADELAAVLGTAGLVVDAVLGDLDGRPLGDETDWMVLLARRP